ncbi:MAG: PspA/IM30 family protein [Methylomonas sp.]|nr:PspA/IM30 family protein [Methylomonas sp.]
MNSLKRIFVSIKSQIDHVADEFENHEALADAAIKDLQSLQQKTRLHLHRVSRQSSHYQEKIKQETEQAGLWSERAVKIRSQDEAKALQCVKRLRDCRQQIALFEQQYQQSSTQEDKIRRDLEVIQEQIHVLNNKKELLAARQNRNRLQSALQNPRGSSLNEVQDLFDRWEGAVVSHESESMLGDEPDSFAQTFEQEEDELSLKMLLDELTKSQSDDKEQ